MSINDIKGRRWKRWFTDQFQVYFPDGQNFKNYNHIVTRQSQMSYIENNNSIWVTTNNGVAIFNGDL